MPRPPFAAPPSAGPESLGQGEWDRQQIAFRAYQSWLRDHPEDAADAPDRTRPVRDDGASPAIIRWSYKAAVVYANQDTGNEKTHIEAVTREEAIEAGRREIMGRDGVDHIVDDRASKPRGKPFAKGGDARQNRSKSQDAAPDAQGDASGPTEGEDDAQDPDDQPSSSDDSEGSGGESGQPPQDPTLREVAKQLNSAMDQGDSGSNPDGGSKGTVPDLVINRQDNAPLVAIEAIAAVSSIAVGSLEPAIKIVGESLQSVADGLDDLKSRAQEAGLTPDQVTELAGKVVANSRLDLDGTLMADGATLREAIAGTVDNQSLDELTKLVGERLQTPDTNITVVRQSDDSEATVETTIALGRPVHPAAAEVVELIQAGMEVMLIGPTGCGKTHLARDVAEILDRRFFTQSITEGTTESQLTGWYRPIGQGTEWGYIGTPLVDAFENGGIWLGDEWDMGDPNTKGVVHQAFSNGSLPLPNRYSNPTADRHQDFGAIVACNTYGTGANRLYVGRNQDDDATLDRFRIGQVELDYSRDLETALVGDRSFLNAFWAVREAINTHKLRRNLSTRFILDSFKLHAQAGWSVTRCLSKLAMGWSADEKAKVGIAA